MFSGLEEQQDAMSAHPSGTSSSSSSGSGERMTIAYSETPAITSYSDSTSQSYTSTSSTSIETPQSQQSFTSLFENIEQAKKQADFFGYEPCRSAASLHDGPQLDGLEYFWSHNVFQLFCFMMSHLLAHSPDEPAAFLARLVDRCLLYRDRGADPPLLFEEPHVRSVYSALDPGGDGRIRYAQYVTGMKTLGLSYFNLLPGEVDYPGKDVEEELFVSEAKQALLRQLDSILGCSSPAAISRDVMADYRDSQGQEQWSSADDANDDRTSEEIMTKLKAVQGEGAPGLVSMSRHSIAAGTVGRSVLSSKNLVTKYIRGQDQDMPGVTSSRSLTNREELAELKTELDVRKEDQSGITSSHTQRSSRKLEKAQSYDLEKSEVVQALMSSHTIRAAESVVGAPRTSERSAPRGIQPSSVSLKTSKQKILQSSGDNIDILSEELLVDEPGN